MSSKAAILKAIRSHTVPQSELPDLSSGWIAYDNLPQQFADVLQSVGGKAVFVPEIGAINAHLLEIPVYAQAKKICSLVPGVGRSTFDLATVADPHDLEDVDFAIVGGEFGVAENSAVWVAAGALVHRVICFIPQHLAFVVQASQIVPHMHAAYERLKFDRPEFGVFIAGPSKTADIEQSLVIGAHGPRSLTVFVVGEPPTAKAD